MKFKLDEYLPASSAATLTKAGHDVDTVADENLTGAPDPNVVTAAAEAGRILVSLDRGHFVTDDTFAAAVDLFGQHGVVDAIGALGNFSMEAMLVNAFQAEPQPRPSAAW